MSCPPHPRSRYTDQLERLVIGAVYGADGYTTRTQADELAHHLRLRPGMRLLELGSGQGWPGLYLAKTTGCHVVLTDLLLNGLHIAAARAATERLQHRCAVLAAGGRDLPFAAESFDAVTHADVMC